MRGWELERPPRWGIVALVLLVLMNVALVAVAALSTKAVDSYGESRTAAAETQVLAQQSPRTSASETEDVDHRVPVMAVYGDGYAAGNESGGLGEAGWPALVAERTEMQLQLHAVSQSGYASVGTNGQDFLALVADQPVPGAAVTVIFGSRNDLGESVAVVAANAAEVISTVRSQAPGTEIVVVGPAWDDAAVPTDLLAVRDAVRSAVEADDVTFVDPLADEWFAAAPGLIAADGISPNDEGHAYLADQVAPVVRQALRQSVRPTG